LAAQQAGQQPPPEPAVEEDEAAPASPWTERWRALHESFHRYRYAWLGVTLFVLGLSLLGMYRPDHRPSRVRVSGQVLIDGQPLQGGTILFVPEGSRPSTGTIDQNGRFTLTCFDGNDGAVVGWHRIAIAPVDLPGEDEPAWVVPPRYADHLKSGLEWEVKEPTGGVVIELVTEQVAASDVAADTSVSPPLEQ
jgi:hypothetical protein